MYKLCIIACKFVLNLGVMLIVRESKIQLHVDQF